jgi:hypothetical protein
LIYLGLESRMFTLLSEPRPLLYQLSLDIPDRLEFEQVDWKSIIVSADSKTKFYLRQTCSEFNHLPVLSEFCKNIQEQQSTLLERLWQHPFFKSEWGGYTYDQLKSNTSPYCELCKDLPGFDTGIHLDCRQTVTAGMVFFNHNVIEEKSTTFYSDHSGNSPIMMPCAFGQGWYSANNPFSWHSGGNYSNELRYSIKFGYHLNII